MTDLRKLSEAATPGEWEHADHFADVRFDREIWPVGGLEEGLAYANASDAAFIAALVNDFRSGSLIPLSEYEHLLALLGEAREALLGRDGGAHDTDCRSQRLYQGVPQLACNCGHDAVKSALSRIDDALAAQPEAKS